MLEAESDSDVQTDSRFATGKNLALDFLSRNLEGLTDPYAVSIITFVLTMADHYSKQGAFNILEGLAKISGSDFVTFQKMLRFLTLVALFCMQMTASLSIGKLSKPRQKKKILGPKTRSPLALKPPHMHYSHTVSEVMLVRTS